MNTDIEVIAIDWRQSALLTAAEQVFHDMEARFSRFRPDSELTQFNTAAGSEVTVSPQLLQLLDLATYYNRETGRIFEPAILPQLEAAGYDRSFEYVPRCGDATPRQAPPGHTSIADLRIDYKRRTIVAPLETRVDLGGIGKGCAVDAAAATLAPARDFLVNAGGDIFAAGNGPDGIGWPVAVSDPEDDDRDLDLVILYDQAIATSTTARRRWQRGHIWQSHIIDPRTGRSTRNNVVSVSVIAATATEADVFAKTALILGVEDGSRFLEKHHTRGLFVLSDGAIHRTVRWPGRVSVAGSTRE